MTIPAMAPPDSPLLALTSMPLRVTLAPVTTGGMNGTVVVGALVAVAVVMPEDVGRRGAPAVAVPVSVPVIVAGGVYVM
jgi:hypothetical protein